MPHRISVRAVRMLPALAASALIAAGAVQAAAATTSAAVDASTSTNTSVRQGSICPLIMPTATCILEADTLRLM